MHCGGEAARLAKVFARRVLWKLRTLQHRNQIIQFSWLPKVSLHPSPKGHLDLGMSPEDLQDPASIFAPPSAMILNSQTSQHKHLLNSREAFRSCAFSARLSRVLRAEPSVGNTIHELLMAAAFKCFHSFLAI